jgi:fatty-acyl-CoA synthase
MDIVPASTQVRAKEVTQSWVRALEYCKDLDRRSSLAAVLADVAASQGDRLALIDPDEQVSYRDLVGRTNRYARWALAQAIRPGDVVCLMMPNCADFVAIWLGITQVGGVVALVNTNLVGAALGHSIGIVRPTHLIASHTFLPSLTDVASSWVDVTCWVHGETVAGFRRIEHDSGSHSDASLNPSETVSLPAASRALIIYTSGTTGFPKAVNITHARILEWSFWFAGMMNAQPEDRLYNCLPFYHSTGGIVAIGAMLVRGASVLIRPRFSASRFWDEVVEGECTIFQYIGELCRYLARAPAHPREGDHHLRLCCGNGLRQDVWEAFEQRFAIPKILEFYAATEGGVSLYNCESRPGAIGRVPAFLTHRFAIALIRCDPETGDPIRDPEGFCIRCLADEPGEAIGRLDQDSSQAARQFDGYTDASASERKRVRNVFKTGDQWLRTGDLMRRDSAGFYYFVDRLGDSYRWKGENISASEVAAAIGRLPGIVDCVVYGVEIPGSEGRAGMTAISTDDRFNLAALHRHLHATLPNYAHPLFVRLCREIDSTGTFKLVKGPLVSEGYTETGTNDALFVRDRDTGRYVICDTARLAEIARGSYRF